MVKYVKYKGEYYSPEEAAKQKAGKGTRPGRGRTGSSRDEKPTETIRLGGKKKKEPLARRIREFFSPGSQAFHEKLDAETAAKQTEYDAKPDSEKQGPISKAVFGSERPGDQLRTGDPGLLAIGVNPITAKDAIKIAGKKVNPKSIRKISKMFNTNSNTVKKMIESKLLNQEVSKVINKMDAVTFALKTGKSILKIGGALAGADVLFQWYALDNVITGQKFFLGDVEKAVADGILKPDQAREALESSAETRQIAIDKIKLSNSINPLLWAFRKLILVGVETDNATLDLKVLTIENAIATREEEDARLEAGGEPELTSQEQFEANQASIKENQEERDVKADQRDQDFQDRQAERDEELAIRQAERDLADQEKTLFFEALSKRNAGQELTDEEKQLLLDRGIDPDRLIPEQGGGLGFGLFR